MYKTRAAQVEEEIKKLEKANKDVDKAPAVTSEDLATAISLNTGIPVSRVHGSEQELLLHLEDHLQKEIFLYQKQKK